MSTRRKLTSAPSKCVKYQPGKKSALGDKPAIPRVEEFMGMDYSAMPLVRGVVTVQEYQDQKHAVSSIMLFLRERAHLV